MTATTNGSASTRALELQPIVGAACAHCRERILVDSDGRNCKRCGLALHRGDCGRAHKSECKGPEAARAVATHDYDEALPLEFTWPVIIAFALPAFAGGFGLQRLLASPEGEVAAAASARVNQGIGAIVLAALAAVCVYFWAKGRQRASA